MTGKRKATTEAVECMAGKLAFSKAGHDKGCIYLIVREEKDAVWLADGRIRSLNNPKKKNRKHIQPAGRAFSREEVEAFFENPVRAELQIRSCCESMTAARLKGCTQIQK